MIKKCICKSEAVCVNDGDGDYTNPGRLEYTVQCQSWIETGKICWSGPCCKTPEEAISDWNKVMDMFTSETPFADFIGKTETQRLHTDLAISKLTKETVRMQEEIERMHRVETRALCAPECNCLDCSTHRSRKLRDQQR